MVEYAALVLNMSLLCRQAGKMCRRKQHLGIYTWTVLWRKGCFSVLYSFPLSVHFVGFETRDHLINQKLSFTDKLLHDLADPELWNWHKDQFPNSGPAI